MRQGVLILATGRVRSTIKNGKKQNLATPKTHLPQNAIFVLETPYGPTGAAVSIKGDMSDMPSAQPTE